MREQRERIMIYPGGGIVAAGLAVLLTDVSRAAGAGQAQTDGGSGSWRAASHAPHRPV
jgi:hypothetical protein